MGKMKQLTIETEEEREAFERISNRVYQQSELSPRHTVHELMEELAWARMVIRELGDRLAKLEGK